METSTVMPIIRAASFHISLSHQVYRGTRPGLGQVAIKRSDPWDETLELEAKVLCRYHHPCIVQLKGTCWAEDHKALVFELMPMGETAQRSGKVHYSNEVVS